MNLSMIANFAKKKCIVNKLKWLIQYDNRPNPPATKGKMHSFMISFDRNEISKFLLNTNFA